MVSIISRIVNRLNHNTKVATKMVKVSCEYAKYDYILCTAEEFDKNNSLCYNHSNRTRHASQRCGPRRVIFYNEFITMEIEVPTMPTSSIFTNIKITDPESAEKFVAALEAASKIPSRIFTTEVKSPLRDKEKIKELFAKKINK